MEGEKKIGHPLSTTNPQHLLTALRMHLLPVILASSLFEYAAILGAVLPLPSFTSPIDILYFVLLSCAGIPASAGTSLDCLQDDNPPHWLKSLQALTEMDGPASSVAAPVPQPLHSSLLDGHLPLHHRAAAAAAPAGWAPYMPPATANPVSHFHSPPPGFQTAFRPPGQPATELLQSAAADRH